MVDGAVAKPPARSPSARESVRLEIPANTTRLPWSSEPGESRRLIICLFVVLLLTAPLALIIPFTDVPELDRETLEKVPAQLARLIEAKPEPEKPKPVPVEPVAEPVPEPKPDPVPEPDVAKAPEPTPKPVKPAPPKENQTVQQAREVAAKSGLMALQTQLSDMQSMTSSAPVQRITANVDDASATSVPDQTAKADVLQGNGPVKDSRGPTENVAVASHDVREIAVAKAEPAPKPQPKAAAKSGPGERSMANIRKVFDQQKSSLFSLYNRELRQNPMLAGEVMLEITIEPNGQVSHCEIVSSELGNTALESKIVNRVRLFNFGAAQVERRQVRFPIDFLPS
ncbi:TonB family protein [Marinobacter sp. BGYM27]|uniref:TonB family protein n=1 Tax=unclassified Marinobacter TaxID=83889 RepID=UPI0021A6AC2C|nr:TonB family protein [Marinobacter sp. BGYM27]MDG5499049.1 TonB family protein [Marinobacter sp. BGYM27]